MQRLQLSLKSLLLICVYAAICSMVYVHPNLWVGMLVIVATIVWFGLATLNAFRRRNSFSLGFTICGWSWLVFWLGFYVQTPPTSADWNLGPKIYQAATAFRALPPDHGFGQMEDVGALESIYESTNLLVYTDQRPLPAYHNANRLMVCLTALLIGVFGGLMSSFLAGRREKLRLA